MSYFKRINKSIKPSIPKINPLIQPWNHSHQYALFSVTSSVQKSMAQSIKRLSELSKKSNALRVSVNPFIPKPHTPFQWEKFDFDLIKADAKYLKSEVHLRSFKMESPKNSLIQYVLSNGGEDLGDLIERSLERKVQMKEWKNFGAEINPHVDLP